jgi:glycogen synthase
MEEIINKQSVGVVLKDFSEASMKKAIIELIKLAQGSEIKNRCRTTAIEYFSLEDGVNSYSRVYKEAIK